MVHRCKRARNTFLLTLPGFQLFADEDLESLLEKIDVVDHGTRRIDQDVDVAL